jgi:hypothetical protein
MSNVTYFIYFWILLYIFRVASTPIIRAYITIQRIWHFWNHNYYLSVSWWTSISSTIATSSSYDITSANVVDIFMCAPDDGCVLHTKNELVFPEINKLCNVATCWIFIRIHLSFNLFGRLRLCWEKATQI